MKPDSRRVYVFIVAGLITAVVVGVAVWRMSSPSANYSNAADQSATTSVSPTHTAAEETTNTSTDRSPSKKHSTHATSFTASSGDAKHQQPHNNDPFLAPNAVMRPQAATQPTKVYRPENISPQDTSSQGNNTTQGGQGTGQGNQRLTPDYPSNQNGSQATGAPQNNQDGTTPPATTAPSTPQLSPEAPAVPDNSDEDSDTPVQEPAATERLEADKAEREQLSGHATAERPSADQNQKPTGLGPTKQAPATAQQAPSKAAPSH